MISIFRILDPKEKDGACWKPKPTAMQIAGWRLQVAIHHYLTVFYISTPSSHSDMDWQVSIRWTYKNWHSYFAIQCDRNVLGCGTIIIMHYGVTIFHMNQKMRSDMNSLYVCPPVAVAATGPSSQTLAGQGGRITIRAHGWKRTRVALIATAIICENTDRTLIARWTMNIDMLTYPACMSEVLNHKLNYCKISCQHLVRLWFAITFSSWSFLSDGFKIRWDSSQGWTWLVWGMLSKRLFAAMFPRSHRPPPGNFATSDFL